MGSFLFFTLYFLGLCLTFSIYFNLVPRKVRYPFFFLLVFGVIGSVFCYHLNPRDLGFNLSTINSLLNYAITTLAMLLVYKLLERKVIRIKPKSIFNLNKRTTFYILLSAPLQEFVFRAYLYAIFQHFNWISWWLYIIASGVTFSLAHVYFKDKIITFGAFALGVIWAVLFYRHQDLLSLSLSHAVIGMIIRVI